MSNLQRLQSALAQSDLKGLLVSDLTNVQWLTGFTGSFGYCLVTPDSAAFVTDSRYTIQAQEQVHGFDLLSFGTPRRLEDVLLERIHALGLASLGFEGTVLYSTYDRWQTILTDIELVLEPGLLKPLRMIKTPEEIAKIQAACQLADATMEHASRMIQKGVREFDIHLDIEFFIRRNGAQLGFEPIVVSGPNSARPHGKATERPLQEGDFLTIDLGAQLDGYCSDITRTFVIGTATDRHQEIYHLVNRAKEESTAKLIPGTPAKDVDAHARAVLNEKDLAQYFGHSLGHGLGRVVHDPGGLGQSSPDTIAVGQVWTIEPGVYIEGFGGVRIEDDIHVTEQGPVSLTHFTTELLEFK